MDKLIKLLGLFGVSGYEETTAQYVYEQAKPYSDSIETDALGNVIAVKKGCAPEKRIMLCASIDSPGFIITVKDGDVFRFGNIGNTDASKILGQTAEFENGARGIIGSDTDEDIKIKNLYVDIIDKKAEIGDVFTISDIVFKNEKIITSSRLSSRLGAYVVLELLRRIKDNKNDIYFVFATQSGLSFRGSKTAAFASAPDMAITIGAAQACDAGTKDKNGITLEGGPAIIIKDTSILAHPYIKSALAESAEKQGIKYQAQVTCEESSEGGAIHLSGSGVITGGVNIPLRYKGQTNELCLIENIENTVKLILGSELI